MHSNLNSNLLRNAVWRGGMHCGKRIQVMQAGLLTLLLASVNLCAPQAFVYCRWRGTSGTVSPPSFSISWLLQYMIPALWYSNGYVPVHHSSPSYHGGHNYVSFCCIPQMQMPTFLHRMHWDFHRLRSGWCIEIKVFPRCLLNSGDIPTAFASWKSWPCVAFSFLWRLSIKGQVHERHLWYVWQSIRKSYKPNSSFMSSMK